jgi:type II secretory pathway component PulF
MPTTLLKKKTEEMPQKVTQRKKASIKDAVLPPVTRTKKETKEVSTEKELPVVEVDKETKIPVPKHAAENEKVTISEPVKATPAPQRKLVEEGKLSTFGLGKERDQFIENLSMLVLSGMSITGALTSIIKQTKAPGMKKILERMALEIDAGSPVWKSFEKTGFFKGYTISLIRLGEESGNFAENLKVVALEEEKDREFKSKVRSALMYPAFVLVLTAVVGIGISWFILPKLAKIFSDLKLALPLVTRILLGFGLFLNKYGIIAVPAGMTVFGGIGYLVFGNPKTKYIGEAIIFSIPGIKTLLMEVEVARFGYLLGTLLEAGLPVTKAIDSLAGASEVIRYRKFYNTLHDSIDMGNSFQKSFASYPNIDVLIPQPIQQLIISGEQSGNLNKTLIKVGQMLEAKSDTTTKNLTIIMEPILLVIVWAGVVSVAFAVILPIYSLVGGLNNA